MVLVFLRCGGILFQPVQHTGLQGVQVRTVLAVGVGIGALGIVQLFLRGSKALGLGHGLKDQVMCPCSSDRTRSLNARAITSGMTAR